MFTFIANRTDDNIAEFMFRLYYQENVIDNIFRSYLRVHNQKHIYKFSVYDYFQDEIALKNYIIYVDLIDNSIYAISNFAHNECTIKTIIAQIGRRDRRTYFTIEIHGRQYNWVYRHTAVNDCCELYLQDFGRTNEKTREIGRGKEVSMFYENIGFSCTLLNQFPASSIEHGIKINNKIILLKNEEPENDDTFNNTFNDPILQT